MTTKETMKDRTRALLLLALLATLPGCETVAATTPRAKEAERVEFGPEVRVGAGSARTYLERDSAGRAASLGLELTEQALRELPDAPRSFELEFPAEARGLGYRFMLLDWRPHGHVPEHIYTRPHFDVHFFMIDAARARAIPGGPDPAVPDSKYVPRDYIAPGNMAEPGMGVHWADSTSKEFRGQPFDQTFIYGFNGGELIFLEPMITHAFLEARPDFTMEVKVPQHVQRDGYYPARHSIRYDATRGVFRISIDELTPRRAQTGNAG